MAYITRAGLALDIFLNVIFGGAEGETISHRAAIAARNGSVPGCLACKLLSVLIQRNHCALTLQPGATPTPVALRAAFFLVLLASAPFIVAHLVF